ncbi:Cef1p Ecym_6234 [Eremothecium cymbalariae DBVPG|uniref:Pre-mRNA-splicing factor CEF1 n=1 Tax=Eremothecium cymbalariae (strain CBS 270.75 / DBVPG 7215 / KCTC 17166 / NRRL Y-17582) TaxID=931890 RepID=G8JVD7_ERECY|nr:hypothetical protein Ecym_6234 [Eremothecium cymbalariae DBVPG\
MPAVPIYVKGGVWTNLEDQILKAAIQKYGTHSWNKVASLLQKKNGKQCQNRWNEFLNPRLNFEKWSRDEDTRLLSLSKQLPNQWRSIGDMLGRTPQLCINRYHQLLDVEQVDGGESLHVGEFNPVADTQPAKLIDGELEDEEREMLAEARARLLNTQGKKATRKIRERMLEESKRIAYLQKRRELKQAGVHSTIRAPKKKYATQLDYNKDVVYEQEPVAVLYDTVEEDKRSQRELNQFEKRVDRKGLNNFEQERSGKNKGSVKKRQRGDVNKEPVTGKNTIVTNEYKKPKLELPKPGTSTAISAEEGIQEARTEIIEQSKLGSVLDTTQSVLPARQSENRKQQKRKRKHSILHLFARLPEPKNDFEIAFDDDVFQETPAVAPSENNADLSSRFDRDSDQQLDSDVLLPWLCESLERDDLVIPEPIHQINDEIDEVYNEHIHLKLSGNFAHETPDVHEYKKHIESELSSIPRPPNTLHKKLDLLLHQKQSPHSLQQKIHDLKLRIESSALLCIPADPSLIPTTKSVSNHVSLTLLPQLATEQRLYHTYYTMYQNECQAIDHRKNVLQQYTSIAPHPTPHVFRTKPAPSQPGTQ